MQNKDATIEINVTADKLMVTANYNPASGDGKKLTPDDVVSQLEAMKITTGIQHESIKKMCASEMNLNLFEIAEGIPPKAGQNARIEQYVNLDNYGKPTEKEDGRLDFYELGEIYSASVGEKLYRRIPPTIGEPGMDVFGNEIPGLAGTDIKIVPGFGTEIDKEDPDLVIASTEGKVFMKNEIMQISEVHTVKGDVNFSTGNVRFKGSVIISGSVKSGFEVDADGDIEIKTNVEDAKVTGGNNVIIKGGCIGSGEGFVKAKNDVYVKFVENQHIEAGRDIFINGESFHAKLFAGRSVIAKGRKGSIVGGICEAKMSVEAGYFGSVACTPTIIKVGIDPKFAEKIKSIESEIKQTQDSIEKLHKSIVFLTRQQKDNHGVLPPDKQALLEKLQIAKKTTPQKLEMLQKEKDDLLQDKKEMKKAYATAKKGVYPKVQVYYQNQYIPNEDTLGQSYYKLVKGELARLSK